MGCDSASCTDVQIIIGTTSVMTGLICCILCLTGSTLRSCLAERVPMVSQTTPASPQIAVVVLSPLPTPSHTPLFVQKGNGREAFDEDPC
jgi:hypothetical protein